MESFSIKCPSCGGNQIHQISPNTFECDYCGETFIIDGAAEEQPKPQENEVIEKFEPERRYVSIYLDNVGINKQKVIDTIYKLVRYELETCQECVDKAPCVILENVPKIIAEGMKDDLIKAGATVSFVDASRPVDVNVKLRKSSGCMSVIAALVIISSVLMTVVL